jgi:hypothetical protein
MDWLGVLLHFNLPVGRMLRGATCSGWLGWPEHDVALIRHPVGLLDGAQPDGYPRLAGGAGLVSEAGALPGPLVEPGQHDVGSVDLVGGVAEILADRPEIGAPADAVFQSR